MGLQLINVQAPSLKTQQEATYHASDSMMFLSGGPTLRMPTTHFVMYWKEVSWSPLAKEPGRAATQPDTGVQNLADVNLTLHDVLKRSVVESRWPSNLVVPPGNTTLAHSVANDNADILACTSWHTEGNIFGIAHPDRVEGMTGNCCKLMGLKLLNVQEASLEQDNIAQFL